MLPVQVQRNSAACKVAERKVAAPDLKEEWGAWVSLLGALSWLHIKALSYEWCVAPYNTSRRIRKRQSAFIAASRACKVFS